MKNNEKLLYTIGDADEKNIPEASPKKKKSAVVGWTAGIGACAAAAAIAVAAVSISGNMGSVPSQEQYPTVSDSSISEPAVSDSQAPVSSDTPVTEPTATEPSDTPAEQTEPLPAIYPDSFDYEKKTDDLPVLAPGFSSGAMGFEGYTFESEDELSEMVSAHNNPWTQDTQLSSLPVFKNKVYEGWTSQGGIFIYLSEEEMKNMIETAAQLLDKEIASMKTETDMFIQRGASEDGYPSQEAFENAETKAFKVNAECSDGTKISIYGDGSLKIELDPAVQLPDGYSLDAAEATQKTMEYLYEQYAKLLQYSDPAFYSDTLYNYVYDKGGDLTQNILNYYLSNARFCVNGEGGLWIIYIDNHFCSSEYMGDYPIISYDEAKQLLKEGNYVTSAPFDGEVSDDMIGAGELVYRNGSGLDEYFMPYYRFYVLFDENDSIPEYNYAALYVPAVSSEYLTDMSVWNGSFN